MKKEVIDKNTLAHTTWNCEYYVVYAPKYRRKVFFEEKRAAIRDILRKLCEWKGVEMVEGCFLKEVLLLYVRLQHGRSGEYKPRSSVPRHEIVAIAHTFYPAIVTFFESEEGKREYEEWKAKREEQKEKKTPDEQSA